jgi:hypothetical protein
MRTTGLRVVDYLRDLVRTIVIYEAARLLLGATRAPAGALVVVDLVAVLVVAILEPADRREWWVLIVSAGAAEILRAYVVHGSLLELAPRLLRIW